MTTQSQNQATPISVSRKPLIQSSDLMVGYEGRPVACSINFSLYEGDYLCIVGENGSGKSTLIKTILGLIKPVEGEISFAQDLSPKSIGYMPQQTQIQRDFPASVQEIVRSGFLSRMGLRPFYGAEIKKQADEFLAKLGIEHLKTKSYRELSGGQQQRVLLARALASTQRLLLLDEPASGLDPRASKELYELIAALNKHEGITIIMISHDIHAAVRYADSILQLGSGKTLFCGSIDDYKQSVVGKAFGVGE